jgi:hypothetical protein
MQVTTDQGSGHTARIVGRTLRLALGIVLVWMTYAVVRTEDAAFNLRVLAVVLALTAFYAVMHFMISKYVSRLNRWLGALLAVVPVILVFVFGGPVGRVASVAYIGVSLLVQGIRSDGGCEVMSIPAIIFGRRTHLVCILFSPIDWVEGRLTRRRERSGGRSDQTTV